MEVYGYGQSSKHDLTYFAYLDVQEPIRPEVPEQVKMEAGVSHPVAASCRSTCACRSWQLDVWV